jgi:hypothetical protein
MRPYPDIIGKRFGKLTVVERVGSRRVSATSVESLWRCRCDCGGERTTPADPLRRGRTTSCGCSRYGRQPRKRHGHAGNAHKRIRPSSTYVTWLSMRDRCADPKCEQYPRYGGRGIVVCERWRKSFDNFLADMGEKPSPTHSIDRIDGNGNYEPSNCRWATPIEQATNRKGVRRLEYTGNVYSLAALARLTGCPEGTLYYRLKDGWSVTRAVETPVRPKRPNGSANQTAPRSAITVPA